MIDACKCMHRAGGHGASRSHMLSKALKTSASLEEVVRIVSGVSLAQEEYQVESDMPEDRSRGDTN